jgi:uncharacterized membrane protein SpoIIM required for sporulation
MNSEMKTLFSVSGLITSVARAVERARSSIFTVAGTYIISILIGMVMAHTGNTLALTYRDQLVNRAIQQNPALAASQGNNLQAALWDFSGNLVIGALPQTLMGFGIIFPYPSVAYQGWVGGIVSVRSDRTSRLNDPRSAVYYLLTLFLQLTPYSLAVGAGVNVGVSLFRPPPYYQTGKWLGLFPKEALKDVGRIYLLVIPLFLGASLWEFLSPWNI